MIGMLQFTRRAGESVTISQDDTTWMIHVDRVNGRSDKGAVQLLFEAPPEVKIVRSELDLGGAEISRPRRDDAVAAWLKRRRDEYSPDSDGYFALDMALDNYELHSDTGTPLAEEVAGPHADAG